MTTIPFARLKGRIAGDVADTPLERYLLATDGSIFLRRPAAVVYPKHRADVVETVDFARRHGLSLHPRGAGSGLCGSALGGGLVVDFTRYMNRLVRLDTAVRSVVCEPGYRLGELERELTGRGLFFPPDPSSGEYASFGGMVGTNASGAHSVKYGNVADYLVDAELVLSSGRVVTLAELSAVPVDRLSAPFDRLADLYLRNREAIEAAYPPVRHNVAGYNLRGLVRDGRLHLESLLAGAEGTLGIATRLTFRLLDRPAHDSLVVAFFDDIQKAARAVQAILPMGPAGIEVMDKSLLELARESDAALRRRIPGGVDTVLLIEFDGHTAADTETLARRAQALIADRGLSKRAHLAVSAGEKARFWAVRKAAVPILYKLKGEKKILALIEDAVVPTDRLVAFFQGLAAILSGQGVRYVLYGHIAKGLLHTRPLLDLTDPADVARLRPLADAVFDLVHGLGGVVSGEHGDGRLRSTYIARQYPRIAHLFREARRLLDPHDLMNPEIKTAAPPDQMARHLRYGAGYRRHATGPVLLNWENGWAAEIERCHGCTKCTTVTPATRMCPIYKSTRQEAAAPKAKANLLRALISGALDQGALYEKTFQAVVERCVGCGSCRVECPSAVDIPKLALEARARYVKRVGPSLHSRLVSGAERLGRVGAGLAHLAAPLVSHRLVRRAAEPLTGISAERPFPIPARRSLFARVPAAAGRGGPRALYFAGCYAGYLRPAIGTALVQVLTRLGMRVVTPPQHCCGLPLLAKGMVGPAREKVRRNLARWQALLERVDHIVVTCSSCGLALTREWGDLLDGPRIRQVAGKVIHASRLIRPAADGPSFTGPPLRLAYHRPCHLHVQEDPDSSLHMLQALPGVAVARIESHCCGMAGTWGLAAANLALSRTIGSHLIDLIDASGSDAAVTDCPTCEMQIAQLGGRPVRHPVEVVADRLLPSAHRTG